MRPSLNIALSVTPDVGILSSEFERCVVFVFELTVTMGQTDGRTDGRTRV